LEHLENFGRVQSINIFNHGNVYKAFPAFCFLQITLFCLFLSALVALKIQKMAAPCSKSFQDKGQRRRVPLPFALLTLWAAVLVALVAGREARKSFFFFEKASTISLQPQVLVDSPTCSSKWVTVDSTTEDGYEPQDDEDEDEENEAYQLLVDIKEIPPDKISSEENLSMYMIDVVNSLDLAVSVYQCHTDPGLGVVSCLGALHDGHFSIHSWPFAGKVSLDIFARGRTLDIEDAKTFLKGFSNKPSGFLPGAAVASNVRWTLNARGESRPWETAISDLDIRLQDSSVDMTQVSIFVAPIRQRPMILFFFRPHIIAFLLNFPSFLDCFCKKCVAKYRYL
jgi:S-adenosylmethionine/arginine decarboxylase-like enzyme